MYCQERSRREAEYRNQLRLANLRRVRKTTLFRAFMAGASAQEIAKKYGILTSDVENAVRICGEAIP